MYTLKLQETDEYQLKNLGGFERLYPPMEKYHLTEIKAEEPKKPMDALSKKLWMLD